MKGARVKNFYCYDCQIKFTVYTRKRVKGYCPMCGSNLMTDPYDHSQHNKQHRRTTWRDDEIQALKELMTKNLTYKEIAEKIGKTRKSVEHYIYRHAKELIGARTEDDNAEHII